MKTLFCFFATTAALSLAGFSFKPASSPPVMKAMAVLPETTGTATLPNDSLALQENLRLIRMLNQENEVLHGEESEDAEVQGTLKPNVADVVRLVRAEVAKAVVEAYIGNAAELFELNVDDILYLHDLGVPDELVAAMIHRDIALRTERNAETVAAVPQPEKIQAPTIQEPAQPAPQPAFEQPREAVRPPQMEEKIVIREQVREVIVEKPQIVVVEPTPVRVVYAPPPTGATVSYFYESLSPYGTWVYYEPYGWAWQPTAVVVDRTWQPYRNGGWWVATDYGWAWHSTYAWGWAPFHYGRWTYVSNYRWIWVPDTVWAPAWVAWRESDEYCGWAPLPPQATWTVGVGLTWSDGKTRVGFGLSYSEYTFVPRRQMFHTNLAPVCVPRDRAPVVYNQTTIINNNYVYNDNRIINRGPTYASIEKATGQKVSQVRIVDSNMSPGKPLARNELRGNALAVNRPAIAASAPETPAQVSARLSTQHQRPGGTSSRAPSSNPPALTAPMAPGGTTALPNTSSGTGMRAPGGSGTVAAPAPARDARQIETPKQSRAPVLNQSGRIETPEQPARVMPSTGTQIPSPGSPASAAETPLRGMETPRSGVGTGLTPPPAPARDMRQIETPKQSRAPVLNQSGRIEAPEQPARVMPSTGTQIPSPGSPAPAAKTPLRGMETPRSGAGTGIAPTPTPPTAPARDVRQIETPKQSRAPVLNQSGRIEAPEQPTRVMPSTGTQISSPGTRITAPEPTAPIPAPGSAQSMETSNELTLRQQQANAAEAARQAAAQAKRDEAAAKAAQRKQQEEAERQARLKARDARQKTSEPTTNETRRRGNIGIQDN